MNNTSGQKANAIVPPEIERWNWGAFLLSLIWGLCHNTHIALLMLVPGVNLVMPFVLGAKGSEWAWRNKRWESVEAFKAAQRKWAKAAIIIYVGFLVFIGGVFLVVSTLIKNSDVFKLAMQRVQTSTEVVDQVGLPISSGFPSGQLRISGPSGEAELSFSVEGPRGEGTVFVEGVRKLGAWRLEQIVFEEKGSGRRFDLSADTRVDQQK